jgi:nitric oxide reductase large subunit
MQNPASEGEIRVGTIIGIIEILWLGIGVAAAAQRGYFAGEPTSCTTIGTVALTIVTGPLNYTGLNPKVSCEIPQPSK